MVFSSYLIMDIPLPQCTSRYITWHSEGVYLMATQNKPYLPPLSSKEQERLNRFQQNGRKRLIKGTGFAEKALWDWLMLLGVLAIPVAVAFGTLLFSQQQTQSSQAASERQHQTDIQIANEQQQEATLQIYLDHISDLLLNHKLLASKHS